MTGGSKHRGSTEVELRTAGGECPHVVGRTASLSIGAYLVGFQRRIIVQTVGNRRSITEMVVVVENTV